MGPGIQIFKHFFFSSNEYRNLKCIINQFVLPKTVGENHSAKILQITTEYITTSWAVVKGFFSREQKLLEHIGQVEKSLHHAGWQSQQDRIAHSALISQYNELYEGYQKILGSYESLLKTIGEKSTDTPPPSAYEELRVIFEKPDCTGGDDDFDEDISREVNSV